MDKIVYIVTGRHVATEVYDNLTDAEERVTEIKSFFEPEVFIMERVVNQTYA